MRAGRKLQVPLVAVGLCLLVMACPAGGRTILVQADGTGDYPTIQAAIDAADDGDEVVLMPGTYTGDGNRDIDFKGKAITVRSTDPNDDEVVNKTIVSCLGTAEEPHRGFYFHSGEEPNSVLAGVSIAHGWQSRGGGIYCGEYCSPTITHCQIVHNSADRGGGLYCGGRDSKPVVSNCRISHNSASDRGGGISCEDLAGPLLVSCLITNNFARTGGGGYFYGRNAHLAHCTVSDNSSNNEGDGIWCSGGEQRRLLISNSIVWGNSGAGGRDVEGAAPIVSYSNVQGGNPGTFSIDVDPLFVAPAAGDYHIAAGSPCIDAGDPAYQYDARQTDIDGQSRIMGSRTDMGADEFPDEVLWVSHRLVFLAREDGPDPPAETIVIESWDSGIMAWQIVEDCLWLEVVPSQGRTDGGFSEVTLSIDTSVLEPGSHSCEVRIVSENIPVDAQVVVVDLHLSRKTALVVPQDYATIQSAIDAAAWGDTIVVHPGTYLENIRFNGKNVTLTSTEPTDTDIVRATIIRAKYDQPVITFSGSEDQRCELLGLTITGGNATNPQHGGGICGNGTTATIRRCHIVGNTAYRRGGGLFECDGLITHCVIDDNEVQSAATTQGAGLHGCDGPIEDCTISHNRSGSVLSSGVGGGLYQCHGTITRCNITGNRAGGNGGGLFECDGLITDCTVAHNEARHGRFASRGGGLFRCDGVITNCTITHNVAYTAHGGVGGGLYQCYADVIACTISGNRSHYGGGGLARCRVVRSCLITGNVTEGDGGGVAESGPLINCTIVGNKALQDGGGAHSCSKLINCTVASNFASGSGGGLFVEGGTALTNSILWHNAAASGDEAYVSPYLVHGRGGSFEIPSTLTIRYTDIRDPANTIELEGDCTIEWGPGSIEQDPRFVNPGRWDPNGTPDDPSDDFWVDGDYHLKSQAGRWDPAAGSWVTDDVTSPCIDAGDPFFPIGREPFPNGGIINMGAYGGTAEASKSYFGEPVCETIMAGDLNGDCKVDHADVALLCLHWLEQW